LCDVVDGALINFITAKQPTVSTSSTEGSGAEYISASDACRESLLYFRNLFTEVITVVLPIKASLDNIGAGCIAQNYVNNSRTLHIDVKYHMVRDWIVKKIFELFYIESNKNLACRHFHQGAVSTCTSWTGSSSSWWTSTPLGISQGCVGNLYGTYDVPWED
jgi:hypothetical protein